MTGLNINYDKNTFVPIGLDNTTSSSLASSFGCAVARDGNGSGKCGYGVCPPASVPAPSTFARPRACPRAKISARARARRVPAGIGQPATRRSRPRSRPQRGGLRLQAAVHRPARRAVERWTVARRPALAATAHDRVRVSHDHGKRQHTAARQRGHRPDLTMVQGRRRTGPVNSGRVGNPGGAMVGGEGGRR
jgi:hypothetical protein